MLLTTLIHISADDVLEFKEYEAEKAYERSVTKKDLFSGPRTIKFNYVNEDLTNIINSLAAERGVNILLPLGPNAIASKVTLQMRDKITLDQAWTMLVTMLDVAGYSLLPKDTMFVIVKNSAAISKEPLPIYIGTPTEQLPVGDQRIRYLYYLSNIKVPESDQVQSELSAIIKDILPDTALYKFDTNTNSMLLIDKANNIRSLIKVIAELDKEGFKETADIIKLRFTSASIVADLFNKNIFKVTGEERIPLGLRKTVEGTFFPKAVKIIPDDRTNSLILLGKPQAIERVKEAILTHIDVELETGESVLHTYQLQYLDAGNLADVLNKIVQGIRPGGVDQSKVVGASGSGPERYFEGVLIKADKPDGQGQGKFFGGNRLIVAARRDDWLKIKQLIEDLDTPRPQVIIEVLVVDLTTDDQRLISSMLRNPSDVPLINTMNFESAQTAGVVSVQPPPTPNLGLEADLLVEQTNPTPPPATISIAGQVQAGSTLIAINDPQTNGIWNILQFLMLNQNSKILSHPHFISTNNQEATVVIGESRLIQGPASGSSGNAVSTNETVDANLQVVITPRISSADNVNLQVSVKVNEFIMPNSNTDGTRTNRFLVTNANVKNGDVLALGGLIKTTTTLLQSETPLLGKIPILGWLFKKRNNDINKNNLTVFISPIIIQPRLRSGIGEYTQDYLNAAQRYIQRGILFDSLRDPVTRWFFKNDDNAGLDLFIKDVVETNNPEQYGQGIATDDTQLVLPKIDDPERKSSDNTVNRVVRRNSQQKKNEMPIAFVKRNNNRFEKLAELVKNNGNPVLRV